MIVKIKVSVSTRYVGCSHKDEIEVHVNDDATPDEIEKAKDEAALDWMWNQVEFNWSDVEKGPSNV